MINTYSGISKAITELTAKIEESKLSAVGVDRLAVAARANHRQALGILVANAPIANPEDFKAGAILQNKEYESLYRIMSHQRSTEYNAVNEWGDAIALDTREAHWYYLIEAGETS